ncbi:hypothetical protein [Paracoccus tibetensis]|uniref:hypothetical protein n=1 Tax=Paracoccus tibetensis TaxID=336292 RepID=UPI001113FAEF|nr:hypothetical protein [Paracoccus tibetensis]
MKLALKLLFGWTLSFLFVGSSAAYFYPGSPNCPLQNPAHTWAKYLNLEYGDVPGAIFSIHFYRDIGDIQGGTCYTMSSEGNSQWSASGLIRGTRDAKAEKRQGGDPTNFELNVWGGQFSYNEAGEVFFVADGMLAGQMYCHYGSECWK